MFTHNRKRPDIVFWVFGIIALGIIIAFAALMFMLISKVNAGTPDVATPTMVDEIEEPVLPSLTSEELEANYDTAIDDIVSQAEIEGSDPIETVLSQVENALLSVRVPKEMQENHLNAVLSIVRMRATMSESPEDTRSALVELLKNLHSN
ncbi:hypothetical protein C0581_00690 [Candidatus Parcubacteria bacterium]|nr:MAG: hypothetical protein C0581_00690 [Candidatus Parcubacteria bacterium]